LEAKVGWGKGIMMGDKNNESENDIPAYSRVTIEIDGALSLPVD
jgi:hypothetical protein